MASAAAVWHSAPAVRAARFLLQPPSSSHGMGSSRIRRRASSAWQQPRQAPRAAVAQGPHSQVQGEQVGCLRHDRPLGDGGQDSVRRPWASVFQLGLAVAVSTSGLVGQFLCQVLLLALEVACGLFSGDGGVGARSYSHSCGPRHALCRGPAPAPPAEACSRLVLWADLADGDTDDEDDHWRVFSERGGGLGDGPHRHGRDDGPTEAQQEKVRDGGLDVNHLRHVRVAALCAVPQDDSRDGGHAGLVGLDRGDHEQGVRDCGHEVEMLHRHVRVDQEDALRHARRRAKRKLRSVRQLQRKLGAGRLVKQAR